MRLIIAATALCLSVTSALSYGALFVGKSGDQIVMGLTVGFPTQQEAFDEARRQCEANSKSLSEPCTLSHIVTNSCVAVSGSQLSGEETSNKIWVRQRATYHNYFSIGMGTDHSQAKYDAEAFCKVTNPNPDCKSYYSACDATPFVPSSLSNSSPWYQSLTQGFLYPFVKLSLRFKPGGARTSPLLPSLFLRRFSFLLAVWPTRFLKYDDCTACSPRSIRPR